MTALTRDKLTDREREASAFCFHEAAHSVAGVVLGGTLRAAVVSGGRQHGEISGETFIDDLPAGREPEVAYSGPWAAGRWHYGRPPTQHEMFGLFDGAGREDYAALSLVGGTGAGAAVTTMLTRCWPAVCSLAAQLWREREVRHGDALAALGLTPETAALGLAHIRAGAAPGSFTVTRPVAARTMT